MEYLRTPDSQFEGLPDYPFAPNYIDTNGARMHYVDEAGPDADKTAPILCLHGEPSWSYLYRKFIPILSPHYRVLAPDLLGFGKSDKPTKQTDYSFDFHFKSLKSFLDQLKLDNLTVVVQDWGGLLGLSLVGLEPERFSRLVIMNTFLPVGKRKMPLAFNMWKNFAKLTPSLPIGRVLQMGTHQPMSKAVQNAYNAPFPSNRYKAGAKIFPALVPTKPQDPGVKEMEQAWEVLRNWHKPALVLFSDKDPITRGADRIFNKVIPSRKDKPVITIKDAGHFLQEDKGEEIADHILAFMPVINNI